MNKLGNFLSECFEQMWDNYRTSGKDQDMRICIKNVSEEMFDKCISYFADRCNRCEVYMSGSWTNETTAWLYMGRNDFDNPITGWDEIENADDDESIIVCAAEDEWSDCSIALALNYNNGLMEGKHPKATESDWNYFVKTCDAQSPDGGGYSEELWREGAELLKKGTQEQKEIYLEYCNGDMHKVEF
jgi:hypothetical protein